MSYGVNAYQQVGRNSAAYADPWRLTAMLFDGALERIAQARGAIGRGETAAKGERLSKAIGILDGLRATLDFEAGGELAINLDSLYDYMQRRLTAANARDEVPALDEVSTLLREVKDGWDGIPSESRQPPSKGHALASGGAQRHR